MDDCTTALATAIGSRVRLQRQARGWTLDHLAEAAGVSRRMVINVEQGSVNPSVGTLLRISQALDVGLPALVEAPRQDPVLVSRTGDGAVLWGSEAGGQGVLLVAARSADAHELWEWTLAPGDRHESEPHRAGTHELLQVGEGALVVEVAHRSFSLGAGDAMTFAGDVTHAYANTGPGPTRFTLAVFEPGAGPASHLAEADAQR